MSGKSFQEKFAKGWYVQQKLSPDKQKEEWIKNKYGVNMGCPYPAAEGFADCNNARGYARHPDAPDYGAGWWDYNMNYLINGNTYGTTYREKVVNRLNKFIKKVNKSFGNFIWSKMSKKEHDFTLTGYGPDDTQTIKLPGFIDSINQWNDKHKDMIIETPTWVNHKGETKVFGVIDGGRKKRRKSRRKKKRKSKRKKSRRKKKRTRRRR